MGFDAYTPDYDLAARALVYRCALLVEAGRFPSRQRHGVRSDPTLCITARPGHLTVEVEHHYTSGHAWMIDSDRDLLLATDTPDDPALLAILGDDAVQALCTLLGDPARWSPAVLAALFVPHQGAHPDPVPPEDADAWELGRSRTQDGRLPNLTLRLTLTGREIVLDHSFSGPERLRHLEVLHAPAQDGTIVQIFGAAVLDAARLLEARRTR